MSRHRLAWTRVFTLAGCSSAALAFASVDAQAKVSFGSGLSQALGGRTIPAIHLGIDSPKWALSFFSCGVTTPVYFHSAYTLGLYRTWVPGSFLWGDVRAGFGIGGHASMRGYRESTAISKPGTRPDYAAGPAIKVSWSMLGPVFVSIEALLGVGSKVNYQLEFQQISNFGVGIRL